MEVHRVLGPGFLETIYQEALAKEFAARGIPFSREVPIPVRYKDELLGCYYKADFVCYGEVIVELKALGKITGVEESQVINYIKATGFEVGVLANFGAASLEYKRLVFSKHLRKSVKSADIFIGRT
jgi:GxxExxY protein